MRISDWSSDVCSSDLPGGVLARHVARDIAGFPAVAPALRAHMIADQRFLCRGQAAHRDLGFDIMARLAVIAKEGTPLVTAPFLLPSIEVPEDAISGGQADQRSDVSGQSVTGRVGLAGTRIL